MKSRQLNFHSFFRQGFVGEGDAACISALSFGMAVPGGREE